MNAQKQQISLAATGISAQVHGTNENSAQSFIYFTAQSSGAAKPIESNGSGAEF